MKISSKKKWYIVQIKRNSYSCAIQNLERQGFEIFLPKMDITKRQKNKFVIRNIFVFPGYMFVCFDPNNINWNKINSTYGVSKILTFNKKPSEISSDLILALQSKYEINNDLIQKNILQKGDTIKFHMGPFANLIGKIESVDEKSRIWVLLEAMGRYHRLKVQNVEKINFTNC